MEKNEIISLVVMMLLSVMIMGIAIAWFIDHKLQVARIKIITELRKLHDAHQKWLFEQLYSIAPGKVLLPDEVTIEEKGKPGEVYHPSRDPMNEFTGKKSDWFDN